jgi:ribosomal protein S18 acetylase RimI-like enzyme
MTQPSLAIRRARLEDADFLAACNAAMALETEHKKLDPEILGRGVRNLLQNPAWGFYHVAEMDGVAAGCLLITFEWSDWRDGLFWWVQSVYVRPEFRRQGIFRALYRHVREAARAEANVIGFRLYVEKDNAAAQATYKALGLAETDYKMFEEPARS